VPRRRDRNRKRGPAGRGTLTGNCGKGGENRRVECNEKDDMALWGVKKEIGGGSGGTMKGGDDCGSNAVKSYKGEGF